MIKVTDKNIWFHPNLIRNLETIIYNQPKDYDFVIIITGSGMTRVGKSVLAQQIGYYLSYRLGKSFTNNNVVFGGDNLIKTAHELVKGSVIINDESRADLSSKKIFEKMTTDLMDFFNECGMYNHIIILVATDFFDFIKGIAVTRSELLINVKRLSAPVKLDNGIVINKFIRGVYDYYGRNKKRLLFAKGKKDFDNYNVVMRDGWGEFRDLWVLDRVEYEKKKKSYLQRQRDKKQVKQESERDKIVLRMKEKGLSNKEIAKYIGVSDGRITQILSRFKLKKKSERIE